MKRMRLAAAILLVTMSFAAAFAQPPQSGNSDGIVSGVVSGPVSSELIGPPPRNPMFDAIDADSNGLITMKELRKAVIALKRLDADRDGNLTVVEAWRFESPEADARRNAESLLHFYDKDGKGQISARDLPQHVAKSLADADTNGDGAFDLSEIAAARLGNGGSMPVVAVGANYAIGGLDRNATESVRKLMQGDRNGDGAVAADEVEPRNRGLFRAADANRDRTVDADELAALAQKMHDRQSNRLPSGHGENHP